MGLYINHGDHPSVFKNHLDAVEPNQKYYHQDNAADMVREQKAINQTLSHAFYELKTRFQEEQQESIQRWETVASQLQWIRNREDEQEQEMAQKLDQHHHKLEQILEHDDTLKRDAAERVEALSEENRAIVEHLAAYETSNQDVLQQVHKLTDMNEHMQQELAEREGVQGDVLGRLENQEALMEKVHRQLSECRAILYERSSYLAEKIEDSYHLTSSYLYKLISGTDQPLRWYVDQQKTKSEGGEDA